MRKTVDHSYVWTMTALCFTNWSCRCDGRQQPRLPSELILSQCLHAVYMMGHMAHGYLESPHRINQAGALDLRSSETPVQCTCSVGEIFPPRDREVMVH